MTDRQTLEEWLLLANKRYREEGIGHAARPWKAVFEYSIQFRHSFIMDGTGPDRFIFEWFKQRSRAGSQEVGWLYESGFLYDGCFWGLNTPIGFGSFHISFPACLCEMPEPLKYELFQETIADSAFSRKLLEHWSNCIDYAYGVRDLIDANIFQRIALARLKSADQDIRAANHLLLADKANSVCARSYRFVAEKLLKAAGWQSGVITSEEEERRRFNHGLKDLAKECGQQTGARFFDEIPASVSAFPSWSSRYQESEEDNTSLWQSVFLAQSIAADVVRLYTDRNIRSQICQWENDSTSRPPTPQSP